MIIDNNDSNNNKGVTVVVLEAMREKCDIGKAVNKEIEFIKKEKKRKMVFEKKSLQ